MSDLAVFSIVGAFSVLSWFFVVLCDRLMGGKP
jgi:hypothetical protein